MSEKPISLSERPEGYNTWLGELKTSIHQAQQRTTLAVNRELVLLYWQIGQDILERQAEQGWGAKVIEQLSQDLRNAFPEMKGFSPRNLKYMRAFAQAWPDLAIVQEVLAQLPWYHQIALLDKLKDSKQRLFYAQKTIENNWSRNVLVMQIETRLKLRCYVVIELKAGDFKPEHLGQLGFYLTAVDRQIKTDQDQPTIGLLLCKSKNKLVAEYALGDKTQPMGIAEYKLVESLPIDLQNQLPSIEQIERELQDAESEGNEA